MPRLLAPALALALALPAQAGTTSTGPELRDRQDFELAAAEAAPRAGDSYPFVRCAALYRALQQRGAETPEAGAAPQDPPAAERRLHDAAGRARVAQYDQPREAATLQAETDIAAIAALYRARFDTLSRRPGRRWWDDALVETDIGACGLLLEGLTAAR